MRLVRTLPALAALAVVALPAHATTFTEGEFVTFGQIEWDEPPVVGPRGSNVGAVLENHYDSVFAPSEVLEVGIPGPTGFSIIFDNPDDVIAYLPASGTEGPLTFDLLDPASSVSGAFGGEVLALALNVAFSDAGVVAHPAGVPFGDLVFQNLDSLVGAGSGPDIAELDGMSVREALSEADLVLGGDTATPFNVIDMGNLLSNTNGVFDAGINGTFDKFLAFPSSTAPTVPAPSTWAMVLIGFAGRGFVGYRASRKSFAPLDGRK
jgi:hypothetical protein